MPRWRGWMGAIIRRTELTDAWKHVLFNQFHDLAAGSGIGVIYHDAQKDYNQVHWAANEISTKSLDTVQRMWIRACRRACAGDGLQPAGLGALRRC